MRVLVACEYSGIVREAFNRLGADAYSCDLLETELPGKHFCCDVRDLLQDSWDMMIAFPPCTYLCSSGMHWTTRGLRDPKLTEDAIEFVKLLLNADIPKIALENPVGCISTRIRRPDQIIHPWQFGHDASKTTCLWLKGLPSLSPTLIVPPKIVGGRRRWGNQTPAGQDKTGPSPDRWKKRSRTYQGIADAMASQWIDSTAAGNARPNRVPLD